MENFSENLLKYKKDPLTLIHKMQQLLQQKNQEISDLQTKLNFIQLPMKSELIYNQHFIFNQPYDFKDTENLFFITLTYDPSFYLPKSESDQVNFFVSLLYETLHLYQELYGSFEHHKSGVVHFHGVFQIHNNNDLNELLLYFKNKLSNKSQRCVNSKPVTNLKGLLEDYLIKENFISIQKKNI